MSEGSEVDPILGFIPACAGNTLTQVIAALWSKRTKRWG